MKFLVDAQLPRRLALRLQTLGHDVLHTLDLPLANRTSDAAINALSLLEHRIVITKDIDFVNSFLLSHQPYKLLLVATGNIANMELETLFFQQLNMLLEAFAGYDFVELDRTTVIIHR